MQRSLRTPILAMTLGLLWLGPAQASSETKLTANDGDPGDRFAYDVAISGDTLVVGAGSDRDIAIRAGSAYVFQRSGGAWIQQAKIYGSDIALDDYFGHSVAISGDTLVATAPFDDDGGDGAGAAYVFVRSGGVWTQQAKLIASDAADFDTFGAAVAIDGDTIAVGANWASGLGGQSTGAVYIFVRAGAAWTEQAKLIADDGQAADTLGASVAIDGDTVVTGAYWDDDAGSDSGSAYVFQRSGAAWTQEAKLAAADLAVYDYFGISVAIAGDTAVVGASGPFNGEADRLGAAYVFQRSAGLWSEQAKLTAGDADYTEELFGVSVAISGDTVAVGAAWDGLPLVPKVGAAYLFQGAGATWSEQARLTAGDGEIYDQFGWAVALDGGTVVASAHLEDELGTDAGAVYVYGPRGARHDLNADGMADILWRNSGPGTAVVWQMNGFAKQASASIGKVASDWQVVDLGDFTGDGKADILWRNASTGAALAWEMDGFTKVSVATVGAASSAWQIAGLGDFDGDGMSDILWRNTGTGANIIWRMNGLARDSAGAIPLVPTAWRVAGVGDFNGDGKADILWRNTGTGASIVWQMDGFAKVASASIGTVSLDWQVVGLADFDGGGRADILWRNTATGTALAWQMNGFTKLASTAIGTVGSDWQIVRLDDYNGGGKADILWRNTVTGNAVVWRMNGLTKQATGSIGAPSTDWQVQ